jgi:methionine synthase II (cobalamin-independent)
MTASTDSGFSANGLPLLIGSLPLADHSQALDWIFKATPEIPLWPQLPGNPYERMMPQFAEGIPCIREEDLTDPEGRILFDSSAPDFDEQMLAFFEEYMVVLEDPAALLDSRFQVSRDRAEGLYQFAETIGSQAGLDAVKGQVTGPFTMLTGIKDIEGRAGYFDDTIREMVIKGIALKAAWQTRLLASKTDKQVIMFIDEPALAGLGSSAFISVTASEIQEMINEVAEAIHQEGGLAGVHVCANTDWELLLESAIDVLSFDAYSFFDKIAPLSDKISTYLDRGSIIAWGIVPTGKADDVENETADSLTALWKQQAEELAGAGRDKAALLRQTFITPSCGTGSLKPELAQKVLDLTRAVSDNLRAEFL